jgi:hypothetical protein
VPSRATTPKWRRSRVSPCPPFRSAQAIAQRAPGGVDQAEGQIGVAPNEIADPPKIVVATIQGEAAGEQTVEKGIQDRRRKLALDQIGDFSQRGSGNKVRPAIAQQGGAHARVMLVVRREDDEERRGVERNQAGRPLGSSCHSASGRQLASSQASTSAPGSRTFLAIPNDLRRGGSWRSANR